MGGKEDREEDSKAKNKGLREKSGCAKRSRKENIAKGYRENGGFVGWGRKTGVS